MILCDTHGGAIVRWKGLPPVSEGEILQSWKQAYAPCRVGISQRGNSAGVPRSSHRPQSSQQRYWKSVFDKIVRPSFGTHDSLSSCSKQGVDRQDTSSDEGMARVGGGTEVALDSWDGVLERSQTPRTKLQSVQLLIQNSVPFSLQVLSSELQSNGAAAQNGLKGFAHTHYPRL